MEQFIRSKDPFKNNSFFHLDLKACSIKFWPSFYRNQTFTQLWTQHFRDKQIWFLSYRSSCPLQAEHFFNLWNH